MHDEFSLDGELEHISIEKLSELGSDEIRELKDRCVLARQRFSSELKAARAEHASGGRGLPRNEWLALERIISWYGLMAQRSQDALGRARKRETAIEHRQKHEVRERIFVELVKPRFSKEEWFKIWEEVDRVEAAQRAITGLGE